MREYTKSDIGGELEADLEQVKSGIEDIKMGCPNCVRENGHKTLCPNCEDALERLRKEEEVIEREMERRLRWLNAAGCSDMSFGGLLDELGIYFAWDALQDALFIGGNIYQYNIRAHDEFSRNCKELYRWQNPEGNKNEVRDAE